MALVILGMGAHRGAAPQGEALMAWAILNRAGTKFGPCRGYCGHVDCNETRRLAGQGCPGCRKVIGYGKPYTTIDGVVWHFECAQDAAEAATAGAAR